MFLPVFIANGVFLKSLSSRHLCPHLSRLVPALTIHPRAGTPFASTDAEVTPPPPRPHGELPAPPSVTQQAASPSSVLAPAAPLLKPRPPRLPGQSPQPSVVRTRASWSHSSQPLTRCLQRSGHSVGSSRVAARTKDVHVKCGECVCGVAGRCRSRPPTGSSSLTA